MVTYFSFIPISVIMYTQSSIFEKNNCMKIIAIQSHENNRQKHMDIRKQRGSNNKKSAESNLQAYVQTFVGLKIEKSFQY